MRIILDTETTGLDPIHDEILELSIIDADTGETLHAQRYEPAIRMEWPAAELINGISPLDVRGCPEIADDQRIQQLIDRADWIGGWNIDFDLKMLHAIGIEPRGDAEIVDIMQMDADLCGMITPDRLDGRFRKLAIAAEWWGYQPPEGMAYHSSVTDCLATRHVYRAITAWQGDAAVDHLVYMHARASMRSIMQSLGIIQGRMRTKMQTVGYHDFEMQMLHGALRALDTNAHDIAALLRGGSDQ